MNPCSQRHRLICGVVLVMMMGTIVFSGFAWPLGRADLTIWPWDRGIYVFSWSTKHMVKLQVRGTLDNGRHVLVDLDRWFTWQAAFESPRYNEIPRYTNSLMALAHYVCGRYNEDVTAGPRLASVMIWDLHWPKARGRRLQPDDVAQTKTFKRRLLRDTRCPPTGMRP